MNFVLQIYRSEDLVDITVTNRLFSSQLMAITDGSLILLACSGLFFLFNNVGLNSSMRRFT